MHACACMLLVVACARAPRPHLSPHPISKTHDRQTMKQRRNILGNIMRQVSGEMQLKTPTFLADCHPEGPRWEGRGWAEGGAMGVADCKAQAAARRTSQQPPPGALFPRPRPQEHQWPARRVGRAADARRGARARAVARAAADAAAGVRGVSPRTGGHCGRGAQAQGQSRTRRGVAAAAGAGSAVGGRGAARGSGGVSRRRLVGTGCCLAVGRGGLPRARPWPPSNHVARAALACSVHSRSLLSLPPAGGPLHLVTRNPSPAPVR